MPWDFRSIPGSNFIDSTGFSLPYRFYEPESSTALPLFILLHGAGERGQDNERQLKHGVASILSEDFRQRFPCVLLVPQCPDEDRWCNVTWGNQQVIQPTELSAPAASLMELLHHWLKKPNIDPQKVYLTGLSMGGYGTWDLAIRFPDLFAAILPICGGADISKVTHLQSLPIWCFHGAKDEIVPVERSREIIKILSPLNSLLRYTEYVDSAHDSWTKTYSNELVYQWLFEQVRS